jgi:hypothetical protein
MNTREMIEIMEAYEKGAEIEYQARLLPLARDKMRSFNRQLAWLAENDDGWREDWNDIKQKKWFIYYDHRKKSYGASYETENQDLNKIYMSEYNVKILAEALNNGEVEYGDKMTREQMKQEVREIYESLTDASIQFKMCGLGGCKDFSFKNFPKKHHEMIKRYVTNKTEEYSSDIVVDFIIDNSENRSCESCKYCDKGQNIQWCDNPEVNKYRNMAHRVDLDFYCKYWSAKDEDK